MYAGVCLVFWIFAMCICVAVTYNNPDDELLPTRDIDTEINNGDWMDKSTVDGNLGSAASKRLHRPFSKPSSVNMQRLGDLRALVQALGTNTDKLDVRTLFPDKRTYEDLKTATEMIKANADKLDGLTTYVKMMKSEFMTMNADKLDDLSADVKMMKSQLMTINADKLDELNTDISMVKSELMTTSADKLDDLTADVKTMKSELMAMNTNKLDDLTADVKMMKSELMTMKMTINHMDPLFVSMFVMLTEITFATSVRIAHHEKDMTEIVNYFQNNVKSGSDILDKKLPPVFEFYTGSSPGTGYTSCVAYHKAGYTTSGKYWITIPDTSETLNVYCDQETDGGGWLVFQRRQDGSVDFYRDWEDYKAGFGEISGEFWLGNDHLHSLTQEQQELRVDLVDFNDTTAFAKYSTFGVGSESEKYALTVNGFSGTAGDGLGYHNGSSFSTMDRDNDGRSDSCVLKIRKGAWWHKSCGYSNLNGIYYDSVKNYWTVVGWYKWKNDKWESLKKTEMKIRPKQ